MLEANVFRCRREAMDVCEGVERSGRGQEAEASEWMDAHKRLARCLRVVWSQGRYVM